MAQRPHLSPTEHFQQARQAYSSGRYAQAADLWQEAAEGYEEAADSLHQAMTLSNLGLTYSKLGRYDDAAAAIATARKLIQALPDTPQQQQVLAQILSAQAQYQQTRGDYAAAILSLTQAQGYYAAVDDAAGVLRSQLNQAQLLRLQGHHRQALRLLNQVAEQLADLSDSSLKANGLRQLGDALRLVESADRARTVLEESLTVAQAIAAPDEAAATLISLGNTAEAQQLPEQALEYYARAVAMVVGQAAPEGLDRPLRAIAANPMLQLQAQVNRLRLLQTQNKNSQAQAQLAEILPAIDTLPPGRSSLFVRINLADLLIDQPSLLDHRAVADLLASTIKQAEALKDTRSHAYTLGYLGKLYQTHQQWSEAETLTRQAISLSQSINADSVTYRWQWQLGQLLATQGNTEAAIESYQQALETLQTLRSDLAAVNPEVRFSFRQGIEPIYRELVNLLLTSDSAQAIPQANLLQARDVIESLQVAELVNFFQADCVVTTPVEIDQVDPEALVIYPIILPDRLEILVSASGHPLKRTSVSVEASEFEATLDSLRQAIAFPGVIDRPEAARAALALQITTDASETVELDHRPLAKQVYDWLIAPIEADIEAADPDVLVFVLDGALRNVPMGVLYDGEQYLIEKHAIALTPGLQLLEPRPLTEQRVEALVAGLSEGRDGFSDLPNVETEVTAIQTQVSGEVLLNQDFQKSNFGVAECGYESRQGQAPPQT